MRILLIEDNQRLADLLDRLLRGERYVVDCVSEGEAVVSGIDLGNYDLLVVDLGLPKMGGIEVIRQVRGQGHAQPILILTAEDGLQSRVAGLNAGADDYVTKPFEIEELLARIRVLYRRVGTVPKAELTFGPLVLNQTSRLFSLDGAPLPVSPREHAILEALLRRAGQTVAKETLLESGYGFDDEVAPAAVEVVVHRLRRKLAHSSVAIATLRGLGYVLRLVAP